jgi:hypothetical protein
MAIKDKFKDLLYAINKSGDLTADFEKHLDGIKDTNILNPHKKKNWIDLVNVVSKKNGVSGKEDFTGDITNDLIHLTPSEDRLNAYKNIMSIKKRIPILGRTLRIWADNILSPDDINKKVLNVTSDKEDVEGIEADLDTLKQEFKNILKKTDLEKKADKIIQDTLLLGDYFIEISSQSKEENEIFSNVIKENTEQITIPKTEYNINVNYITTENLNFNSSKYNIDISQNELREDSFNIPNPKNLSSEEYDDEADDDQLNVNKNKSIDYDEIILRHHEPKHIINITKNGICLGYLYVEHTDRMAYSNYSSSPIKTDDPEDEAFKIIVDKVFNFISNKLNSEGINDIPVELRNVLVNIIKNANRIDDINVRFIPENNMVHFKLPSLENDPYGASIFADLEFILKMYLARMVSSTIYRIARAGKHLVFTVDVSGTRDAAGKIENVKRAVKNREVKVSDLNDIENIPSIVSTFEDYYLPSKDGKKYVEMDQIEMGSYGQDRSEEDQTLLKNILTGIEIPPSYLGVEEFNSTKATLTQESMIFARSVIRYQKLFSEYLTETVHKIYVLTHDNDDISEHYTDIYVSFMPPRGIITESLAKMYSEVRDIHGVLKDLGVPEEKILRKFLPEYDFDEFYIEELEKGKNSKEETEAGKDIFGGEEEAALNDLEGEL